MQKSWRAETGSSLEKVRCSRPPLGSLIAADMPHHMFILCSQHAETLVKLLLSKYCRTCILMNSITKQGTCAVCWEV